MSENKVADAVSLFNGESKQAISYASTEIVDAGDGQIENVGYLEGISFGNWHEEILKWYVFSSDPTERADEFLQQHIALTEQQR